MDQTETNNLGCYLLNGTARKEARSGRCPQSGIRGRHAKTFPVMYCSLGTLECASVGLWVDWEGIGSGCGA